MTRESEVAHTVRSSGKVGPVEWAMAGRALPGEAAFGDRGVVLDAGDGSAVFGVIDGLGHGEAAALAADIAASVLTENSAEPLDVLMLLSHRALTATRGAAISLASINFADSRVDWLGVGNVAAVVIGVAPGGLEVRATAPLIGGIVGYRLPTVQSYAVTMRPGDLLVLASDGIVGDFVASVDLSHRADEIVAAIVDSHARASDDAFVLAARHRGTVS
ncbi:MULTISPECIES: SpoIIE family protein phosphatase [Antrihabitans]|nr:SpoIIE family protein phosphatase [Antrihabitans stalagmiti]